ncbi:hypothetical protein EV401DRAFT_1892911 [Pisolithus croceorrhizus]|nr:hypothetical protein EV401DRAFT_1892911 [Pisolithus croceorrhizus]
MIKERHFKVHPEVLTCLLHLRLKSELDVRASDTKVDRAEKLKKYSQGKAASRRSKGKPTDQPHLSKKAKKTFKERKEIEKEVREAEAEVDKEERAGTVLRGLIVRESTGGDNPESLDWNTAGNAADILNRLFCIVTAFELPSGQGEALNIDLTYYRRSTTLRRLNSPRIRISKPESIADMLFRALNIVFSPRESGGTVVPWRSAAFAKRLLIASINWPPNITLRALEFIEALVAKDPKLEALLSTEDRSADGVYLPQIDDPQLSHFWVLRVFLENGRDTAAMGKLAGNGSNDATGRESRVGRTQEILRHPVWKMMFGAAQWSFPHAIGITRTGTGTQAAMVIRPNNEPATREEGRCRAWCTHSGGYRRGTVQGNGYTNDVCALPQPEVRTQYSNRLPGCTRKPRTVMTEIVIGVHRDMRRMGKKQKSEGPASLANAMADWSVRPCAEEGGEGEGDLNKYSCVAARPKRIQAETTLNERFGQLPKSATTLWKLTRMCDLIHANRRRGGSPLAVLSQVAVPVKERQHIGIYPYGEVGHTSIRAIDLAAMCTALMYILEKFTVV